MCKICVSSHHCALDQRSSDGKVNRRSHDIARFPRVRYVWCVDWACIEEASQHAVKFPEESKCRRAACSKKLPILTREVHCRHDLWAFSSHRSSWDDVQDFDTRRDQALLAASEIPTEMVLEGLYQSKLQDSVQLQTALALYEQENIRNNEQSSYSRLKTSARCHIDQTMRTRNFRARNEMVAWGAVTKSQKGRKASVDRKVGECYQWKAIGQCSKKETYVVSVMIPRLETDAIRDKKGQSSSLAPKAKAQTDGKILGRAFLEQEERFRAEISWGKVYESVMEFLAPYRVSQWLAWIKMQIWWQMPISTRWGWWAAQQEVEEQRCERFSYLIKGVFTIGFCVSRFSQEKIYSTGRRKMEIKSHRQILQGHVAPHKNLGKRVHREASFKSANHTSAIRAHPSLRGRHKTNQCIKKVAPAE